jgi:hypothetical protein
VFRRVRRGVKYLGAHLCALVIGSHSFVVVVVVVVGAVVLPLQFPRRFAAQFAAAV